MNQTENKSALDSRVSFFHKLAWYGLLAPVLAFLLVLMGSIASRDSGGLSDLSAFGFLLLITSSIAAVFSLLGLAILKAKTAILFASFAVFASLVSWVLSAFAVLAFYQWHC